jgi:phosphoribosylformylglycinamidine cyclo-ligase
MSESKYSKAGVNIDKGNLATQKIKQMVKKMGVGEIGKFSGFYPLDKNKFVNPVLVSSADGVGTKLKIAFLMDQHNTIGKDLVNHCVDDILVYGAKPLFFLDYVATGKLEPNTVSEIISGIIDGCLENEFILLGGETAEMPGFYSNNEYDVAGFIVGAIDRDRIIDGKNIKAGDLIIGLPSTGLHTNGYSLARHIVFEEMKLKVNSKVSGLNGTIGEELLKTHRSYLKPVSRLLDENLVKGIAHITGGGFIDNIPRILPDGLGARVERTWEIPDIFSFLVDAGKIDIRERYRVFNMGIGMTLIIEKANFSKCENILESMKEEYHLIGQIVDDRPDQERIKIN